MCVQLVSGSTDISDQLNFKSIGTSNSTQTVQATVTPTIAQLEELEIECTLGYYGGAINGATVFLTYTVAGVYYTYTTTISGDMAIIVTIGGSGPVQASTLYKKINGVWTAIGTVYKKVNGSWSALSDASSAFDSSTKYKEG